jgi:hypothetical protein
MSYQIQVFTDRLGVFMPEDREYGVRWAEVRRVHAYRLTGEGASYRVVCFDLENGGYIEVNESIAGFEDMLSKMGEHLLLPPDYVQQINAIKSHQVPVTLYRRT